jgi:hypothetical protein
MRAATIPPYDITKGVFAMKADLLSAARLVWSAQECIHKAHEDLANAVEIFAKLGRSAEAQAALQCLPLLQQCDKPIRATSNHLIVELGGSPFRPLPGG